MQGVMIRPMRSATRMLVFAGIVGGVASLILTIEKISLLRQELDVATGQQSQPAALGCDFSRWASCSGVMSSEQAEAFGFSNQLLGVVGFAVVLTLGIVYASGASTPRWIWAGLQAGVTAGIAFVTWLQIQSIYVIGLLCVYCIAVWIVMIPLFVMVTRESLRIWVPRSVVTRLLHDWTLLVVMLWYVAVAGMVFIEFGSSVFS